MIDELNGGDLEKVQIILEKESACNEGVIEGNSGVTGCKGSVTGVQQVVTGTVRML